MITGRPTKRTPEAAATIINAVREGLDLVTCSALADMAYQTFNEWRKADPQFNEQIEKARAEAVLERVQVIRQAATGDAKQWTAAAWWLERRYPRQWGKLDRVEVTQPIKLKWPWEAENNGSDATSTAQGSNGSGNGSSEIQGTSDRQKVW